MMKKPLKIIIGCIAALAVLASAAAGYYFGCMHPYRGTLNNSGFENTLPLDSALTQAQASEDLSFLMECLESRHPAWLEEDSEIPTAVQSQLDTELAALGEDVTVLELLQAASRITAVMHDGHTWARYKSDSERYIDDITWINEDVTIIAVNSEPSEELYARFLTLFQYELEPYAREIFSSAIIRESYLRLMGVDTSEGVTFTVETDSETFERSLSFVPIDEIKGNESSDDEYKWVSYEIDTDSNAAIFTLRECVYNDEYCAVVKEFFEQVEADSIENVIVDLRGNGGGNSMVADEFLRYVDVDEYSGWSSDVRFGWYVIRNRDVIQKNNHQENAFSGDIYVLTNTETFSAAMDFAMLIGDNDIGVIIGEASGNRPDAYGDCLYFQLPNSKIAVSVSYKRWYRIDQSKTWQPLEPDYPTTSEDAMNKAYELIGADNSNTR